MFKGYISKMIGDAHWVIHHQHLFLMSYLEQSKDAIGDTLLANPIIRKHRYKKMGIIEIAHEDKKNIYLTKIYTYPSLAQKIKQLYKCTRGFNEFHTTYQSAVKNVPVEVPAAFGERRYIFTRASYLIIRKLEPSCSLSEYFRNNLPFKEKRDILREFGKLAADAHNSGIKQDAFSLDNFLVYTDASGDKKLVFIDFEMVSVSAKGLQKKLRIQPLAKLNRAGKYFSNTDRMRFLLSYTNGNFAFCKAFAKQIEAFTIRILKKNARKFSKLCTQKNRRFDTFKDTMFYGYYRRDYSVKILIELLNVREETNQETFYKNPFLITYLTGNVINIWMHVNALSALAINIPFPVGVFKKHLPKRSKEGFLISQIPDYCIPLSRCPDLYSNENLRFSLIRFVEYISSFGTFARNLSCKDFLIRRNNNHTFTCYLGSYNAFQIKGSSREKNSSANMQIMRQLIETEMKKNS